MHSAFFASKKSAFRLAIHSAFSCAVAVVDHSFFFLLYISAFVSSPHSSSAVAVAAAAEDAGGEDDEARGGRSSAGADGEVARFVPFHIFAVLVSNVVLD